MEFGTGMLEMEASGDGNPRTVEQSRGRLLVNPVKLGAGNANRHGQRNPFAMRKFIGLDTISGNIWS